MKLQSASAYFPAVYSLYTAKTLVNHPIKDEHIPAENHNTPQ